MNHAGFVFPPLSISIPATAKTTDPVQPPNPRIRSVIRLAASQESTTQVSHRTAATPPLPKDPVSVLWLRLGHLRLADNPAVIAAAAHRGRLLPVLTISQRDITDSLLAAISNLAAQFHSLNSVLVVRIVQSSHDETDNVSRIATQVNANRIIVNFSDGLDIIALRSLQQRFKLDVWNGDILCRNLPLPELCQIREPPLSDAPHTLPRPPQAASRIRSDVPWQSATVEAGEFAARKRLDSLLRTRSVGIQTLLIQLSCELRHGCLAHVRVRAEFHRRDQSFSNANLGVFQRQLSSLKSFFSRHSQTPAIAALSIHAYDVNGGDRRGVEWDESTKSFVLKEWEHQETERQMKPKERAKEFIRRRRNFFSRAFFPDDVTPDYYSFTAWRFAQRCVSATIGVFGTSSLLFALGIRSGRIGQAAVISWVLKDGLGKGGKMLWAGSMGKDFDVDPKRWRFRSALLYAFGNGLEIVTQIFPASFLLFATAANSMKQVSMLTSSATRNAMYRSFGGRSQNIANITAKGEAQIVVADLIGMGCGIRLSKFVSVSRRNILGVYFLLTALDIFGIYMELRQVVFRTVNAERSHFLINNYLKTGSYLTPSEVSPKERIFLKPRYKSEIRLSSIAKAARDPAELDRLLKVFRREPFMVSVPRSPSGGPCRIVLRNGASNEDVLRAMLVAGYVQKAVKQRNRKARLTPDEEESILRNARKSSKRTFPGFFTGIRKAGWNTDNLLFSTMKRRGFWRREP